MKNSGDTIHNPPPEPDSGEGSIRLADRKNKGHFGVNKQKSKFNHQGHGKKS